MNGQDDAPKDWRNGHWNGWRYVVAALMCGTMIAMAVFAKDAESVLPLGLFLLVDGLAMAAFLWPVPDILLVLARIVVFLHGFLILLVSSVFGACAGMSFGASSGGGLGSQGGLLVLLGIASGILLAVLACIAPPPLETNTVSDEDESLP